MRPGRTKIYSLLLAAVFSWHFCSVTMFPHIHNIDGIIIVHSHPFSDGTETHDQAQLDTIAHLSALLFLVFAVPFLLRLFARLVKPCAVRNGEQFVWQAVSVPDLRGPPSL